MKRSLLLFPFALLLFSCDVHRRGKLADDSKLDSMNRVMADIAAKEVTTVQIIDSAYDFGKTTDGQFVTYNYRFKNTGNKSLVITDATASCGCTVPERPDKPILPGETSFIKVSFNSKGKVGTVEKKVYVKSNARPEFPDLLLTGEVTPVK